jgi:hypothetical protein
MHLYMTNKDLQAELSKHTILQRAAKTARDAGYTTEREVLVHALLTYAVLDRRHILRHITAAISYMRGHSYVQTEHNAETMKSYQRIRLDDILKYITAEWSVQNAKEKRDPAVPFVGLRDDITRWIYEPQYKPTHVRYLPRRLWKKQRPKSTAKTIDNAGISTGQSST